MPLTLIDTSILARLLERETPLGRAAEDALAQPRSGADELAVCAQVLIEFWVVATRPIASNGFDLAPADADASIADFLSAFTFLPDPPELFERWRDLVRAEGVRGKNAHDARLIPLMRSHGATRVLTFNARDFRRYSDVEIVAPPV